MPRELHLVENAGGSMMKTRLTIPLKEVFIVVVLIWAACFICMIPSLIEEAKYMKMIEDLQSDVVP